MRNDYTFVSTRDQRGHWPILYESVNRRLRTIIIIAQHNSFHR